MARYVATAQHRAKIKAAWAARRAAGIKTNRPSNATKRAKATQAIRDQQEIDGYLRRHPKPITFS